jgi:hypothetical protein
MSLATSGPAPSRRLRSLQIHAAPVATLLLATIIVSPASAAAQASGGVISGVVADAQSAVLPGVVVTVRNTDTGTVRSVTTDADGRYRLPGLPPGVYELRAELTGTTVTVPGITLTIGLEVEHALTMQLGSLQESITVTGAAPVVETTRAEVAA